MKKITIVNAAWNMEWQSEHENADFQAWIDQQVANKSWGNAEDYDIQIEDIGEDPKWAIVRSKRNALLASCDWTQIPDAQVGFDAKIAYITYRQALRDLPQDQSDPTSIVWPAKP